MDTWSCTAKKHQSHGDLFIQESPPSQIQTTGLSWPSDCLGFFLIFIGWRPVKISRSLVTGVPKFPGHLAPSLTFKSMPYYPHQFTLILWGPDHLESLIRFSPKQLVQLRVLYIFHNLVEWICRPPGAMVKRMVKRMQGFMLISRVMYTCKVLKPFSAWCIWPMTLPVGYTHYHVTWLKYVIIQGTIGHMY